MHIVTYGHYGRPVLVFPSEAGRAWDFENNGMVDAVADLIDDGRVKLYCVDSLDADTWSDKGLPIEERALRHEVYTRWLTHTVVPYIHDDTAAGARADHHRLQHGRLPRGALRASSAPTWRRWPSACPATTTSSTWRSWGERGDATYFANPTDYVPNLHGDHLTGCASRLSVLLVGRPGRLGDPSDRIAAVDRAAGRAAAGEGHPLRARPVGLRRQPRLGVVAAAARAPSATLLLRVRAMIPGRASERSAVTDTRHLIGLLLGAEEDWPRAFEADRERLGAFSYAAQHAHARHRAGAHLPVQPARPGPRTTLVIDRLAYWYYHPREWLKKVALMDDVYLMNSPFTFQSMEKHSAYCALMRLGMNVPDTVLVPYKNPVDNVRWAYTVAAATTTPSTWPASPPRWATRCS